MVIVMTRKKGILFGVGINDADYPVNPRTTGKRTPCKIYSAWADMLKRCYSKKYQDKYTSYVGCTVCDEWLKFSSFREWAIKQDWQGKQLDKDILFAGNRIYSPETSAFVTSATNNFILKGGSDSSYLGASKYQHKTKFRARCKNPITRKECHIGVFDTVEEAHAAWRDAKSKIALTLAEIETDERIKAALIKISNDFLAA